MELPETYCLKRHSRVNSEHCLKRSDGRSHAIKSLKQLTNPTIVPTALLTTAISKFVFQSPLADKWLPIIAIALLCLYVIYACVKVFWGHLTPRRFANEVFVIDDQYNLAVVYDTYYKKLRPPGRRLGYYEMPHEVVGEVLKDLLGLEATDYEFWPKIELPRYGEKVEAVQPPFQVQREKHIDKPHQYWIREHYDYVYVCRVPDVRPPLVPSASVPWFNQEKPQWMSLPELQNRYDNDATESPFADTIQTHKRLISEIAAS